MVSNIADIIHNIRNLGSPVSKSTPPPFQPKQRLDISKLSLEELGLDDASMNFDGKRKYLPDILLNAFYEFHNLDPKDPKFYEDICKAVRLPNWDYFTEGNPPLYIIEKEILDNRINYR